MSKKFMCVLRSEAGGCEQPSPSDMEAMFARYEAWQKTFADNILDMGSKLGEGAVVNKDTVADGPFVEVKEIVGGYMLLTAEDLSEAVEVIRKSPMVENPKVSIEIREIASS